MIQYNSEIPKEINMILLRNAAVGDGGWCGSFRACTGVRMERTSKSSVHCALRILFIQI